MKKFLCLLAAFPLILTGCGGKEYIVLDSTGGEYYVEDTTVDINDKVKPKDEANGGSGSSKPPKVKNDENDIVPQATDPAVNNDPDSPDMIVDDGNDGEVVIGGENDDQPAAPDPYRYHLEGIVIANDGSSILINEVDLKRISLECDPDQISEINVGDQVTVKYDGELAETYPQQGKAFSVEVTAKAEKKYEMKRFVYRDKFFTIMVPEGWSDRTIEYPQEGDFTDWGIRFQPAGAKGSLDISWHSGFAIRGIYDKRRIKINGYNVTEHSKNGTWILLDYTIQSYVMSNNFVESGEYDTYKNDIDLMMRTFEFI